MVSTTERRWPDTDDRRDSRHNAAASPRVTGSSGAKHVTDMPVVIALSTIHCTASVEKALASTSPKPEVLAAGVETVARTATTSAAARLPFPKRPHRRLI